MGYVALKRLRWGDDWIEPGEPVPAKDEGRSYQSLIYHGLIGPLKGASEMSDAELAAEVEQLTSELDRAHGRIKELEGGSTSVEIPDGVSPGITPGWPFDATTGEALDLTDEQRSALAEKGISGSVVFTHTGDVVVVDGPHTAESDGQPKEGQEIAVGETGTLETDGPAGQTVTKATDGAVVLAEVNGVDLRAVTGTGEDGRIIEADVQSVIEAAMSETTKEDNVSDDTTEGKRVEIQKPEDPESVKKPAGRKRKPAKKSAGK